MDDLRSLVAIDKTALLPDMAVMVVVTHPWLIGYGL